MFFFGKRLLQELQEPTVLAMVYRAFCELQVAPSPKASAAAIRVLPKVCDLAFLDALTKKLGSAAKDEQFHLLQR